MTKELRYILKDILFEDIEVLQEHIDTLKPKEKESCLLSYALRVTQGNMGKHLL